MREDALPPPVKDALALYQRLLEALGPQGWWPAENPWQMMVGALLTQQTTWRSVEGALHRLEARGFTQPVALARASPCELEEVLRPVGFHRQKAERLQAFARMIVDEYGGDVDALLALAPTELHSTLKEFRGFGPETLDAILLYACRSPIPVADAYTRRILRRTGLLSSDEYQEVRAYLTAHLPHDAELLGELHALMVEAGKRWCRVRPRCAPCPLLDLCDQGLRNLAGAPKERVSLSKGVQIPASPGGVGVGKAHRRGQNPAPSVSVHPLPGALRESLDGDPGRYRSRPRGQ